MNRSISGFALPSVLIASIIMLDVLLVSVASTAAVRVALTNQGYKQLSQTAGEAGSAYAQACLDANFGVAEWTDAKPLKPGTDCYGNQLASCPDVPADAACHFVMKSDRQISEFSVGLGKQPLVTGWKSISSSESHSCGIALDNRVYCWGSNTSGVLGNGTSNNSHIPVAVDTSGVLAGKTILKVAVGGFHSCVIASDNKAYCWGSGNNGQLGNFSNVDSYIPVAVDTNGVLAAKTIIDITTGLYHTCALTSENLAYCWGDGFNGQLGNGDSGNGSEVSVPVAVDTTGVLSGRTMTDIEAAALHTCAIADGLAFCWGEGDDGQLGNSTYSDSAIPVAVDSSGVLNGKTISAIAAGETHTCVIGNGLMYCWGENTNGTLGNGNNNNTNVPVAVSTSGVLNGKTIIAISAYYDDTCAVASDNKAYCWGLNNYGQLGNDSTTDSNVPVAVNISGVLSGKILTKISSGFWHSCALATDYNTYCWGFNSVSQLGNNSIANSDVPVAVNITGVLVSGVVSSGTVKLQTTGRTDTWKQFNETVRLNISELIQFNHLTSLYTTLGNYHTCAIASDNNAYCWGSNMQGQSGDGTNSQQFFPASVSTAGVLSGKTIIKLSSGGDHSCVVASDNKAYCWGSNWDGELGNNSYTHSFIPVAVNASGVLSGKNISDIDSGDYSTCATTSEDLAYCWGYNADGGLGDNSTNDSPVPVAVDTSGVLNGKSVTAVSVGTYHTCAIADGLAYCWGGNTYGKLGDGTTTESHVPVAVDTSGVLNGLTVLEISANKYHTCVIASDNKAYCWGRNNQGQLGDGTTNNHYSPYALDTTGVLNGKTIISISVGIYHTCVVASDNKAYCWGDNSNGQLGNDSLTDSYSPVAVDTNGGLNNKTVTSVAANLYHTCAIISDGRQYCWGNNANGELGDGSTNESLVPVAVELSYLTYLPINF